MKKFTEILKNNLPRKKSDFAWWGALILVFILVQQWQTRNLLDSHQKAPEFKLQDIAGKSYSLSEFRGRPVLIYFFAPWCSVCKLTGSNLSYLRTLRDSQKLVILAIGVSYSAAEEVSSFALEHGIDHLKIPVLLGDSSLEDSYNIQSVPTFYFIDADGQVRRALTGYASTVGLFLRSF